MHTRQLSGANKASRTPSDAWRQISSAMINSLIGVQYPPLFLAMGDWFENIADFGFILALVDSFTLNVEVGGMTYPVKVMYLMVFLFFLSLSLPVSFVLITRLLRPSELRKQIFCDRLTWL